MAIQPLTSLPAPPLPTDGEDAFDQHAGDSLTAQVNFTNEMNTNVIPGINQAVTDATSAKTAAAQSATDAAGSASAANTSKNAAATSATQATTNGAAQVALAAAQVTLAAGQVTLAQQARDSAQAAAAAAGSAAGLPALSGAGNILTINSTNDGVAFISPLPLLHATALLF